MNLICGKIECRMTTLKFTADADDPDALVRICMTLMITVVLEVHKGIAGLWQ